MRWVGLLAFLVVMVLPGSAQAEVMDKEPTASLVWAWVVIGGVIGAQCWSIRWRLGLTVTLLVALFFADLWAEILDPFVGPAILKEAGAGYVWNAGAATLAVIALHVLGALRGRSSRVIRRSAAAFDDASR